MASSLTNETLYKAFRKIRKKVSPAPSDHFTLSAVEKLFMTLSATLEGRKRCSFELRSDVSDQWYKIYEVDSLGSLTPYDDTVRNFLMENSTIMEELVEAFPLGRAYPYSPTGYGFAKLLNKDMGEDDGADFEKAVIELGEQRLKEYVLGEDAEYVDAFPQTAETLADLVKFSPFGEDGVEFVVYEFRSQILGSFLLADKRGVFDHEERTRMLHMREAIKLIEDPLDECYCVEAQVYKGEWNCNVILIADGYTDEGPESLKPAWYAACLFLKQELKALNAKYHFYRGQRKRKEVKDHEAS